MFSLEEHASLVAGLLKLEDDGAVVESFWGNDTWLEVVVARGEKINGRVISSTARFADLMLIKEARHYFKQDERMQYF